MGPSDRRNLYLMVWYSMLCWCDGQTTNRIRSQNCRLVSVFSANATFFLSPPPLCELGRKKLEQQRSRHHAQHLRLYSDLLQLTVVNANHRELQLLRPLYPTEGSKGHTSQATCIWDFYRSLFIKLVLELIYRQPSDFIESFCQQFIIVDF